jgi:uncharacterized protein
MFDIAFAIGSVLAGVFVGVMSGLLGIGGGTVMVPLFRLAFGLSPVTSTATSLFAIIPTSISGVSAHLRGKTCIPKLGIALGLGGAVMSPIGVLLANISPAWLVMVVAALIIGFSAFKMFRKAAKMKPAKAAAAAAATGEPATAAASSSAGTAEPAAAAKPAASETVAGKPVKPAAPSTPVIPDPPELGRREYLIGVGIGMIAGLASGYVGVGGGFIMVPMMLAILSIPMTLASGTSLIAIMILAIPGVIEQAVLGNINYLAGIAMVVGTIPGAVVGARLIKVIPERQLRFLFGCFLLVAAVLLLVKEFGILG